MECESKSRKRGKVSRGGVAGLAIGRGGKTA